MVFFKKRKHKLPKFPATVAPTFKQLCEVIDQDGIADLRKAIDDTLDQLYENKDKESNVDIESAEALGERCRFLLDQYDNYPPEKQKLIVGAVRYFAIADDPFDDATFATGYFDDMKIINYVLEELEIEGHYFEIR